MNLPNKLTLFRIILVPILIFVWIFPFQEFGINFITYDIGPSSLSLLNIIILGIFLIASFTDYLDGHIARKHNLVTTFGKFADPIADKLIVNSSLVLLCVDGKLPVVPVVLMVCRDMVVDGCRMIAAQNGVVVSAGMMGKLKTVLQMITISFAMLNNLPFELISIPMTTLLVWFTCFVSLASGYGYYKQVSKFIMQSI